jgi:hypothetical protein
VVLESNGDSGGDVDFRILEHNGPLVAVVYALAGDRACSVPGGVRSLSQIDLDIRRGVEHPIRAIVIARYDESGLTGSGHQRAYSQRAQQNPH